MNVNIVIKDGGCNKLDVTGSKRIASDRNFQKHNGQSDHVKNISGVHTLILNGHNDR